MHNSSQVTIDHHLAAAAVTIREALLNGRHDITGEALRRRVKIILADVVLLARCAKTKCLITYTDAIVLRGHGNRQNGQWLDEVYAYAIAPLGFPDLTMLVVNKTTKQPSPDAFEARRSILSKIHVDDIAAEQRRCVWFSGYEEVLGPLDPIPSDRMAARLLAPQPAKEREIARAVGNAIGRVTQTGLEKITIGREYPESLPRAELVALVGALWDRQNGRCALTGQAFELRSDEEGGVQDDRVSLDRIDNLVGYTETNVQLVTQFANRARGILPVEEARRRLVQFGQ
ncbi:hypothetical protein [Sinorhizobium meliloti]|uniref:hypothetical protein n=1 Tax=Rhizobium meliloti TaxID=382 RepID=UPI000FD98D5D|nr:hypothetical protein [Sinorhizobium meliloti]RVG27128.1 hypothetical protein CN225_27970 [Sinorhizobium meliloti]